MSDTHAIDAQLTESDIDDSPAAAEIEDDTEKDGTVAPVALSNH
jgi:hypothetical protein